MADQGVTASRSRRAVVDQGRQHGSQPTSVPGDADRCVPLAFGIRSSKGPQVRNGGVKCDLKCPRVALELGQEQTTLQAGDGAEFPVESRLPWAVDGWFGDPHL